MTWAEPRQQGRAAATTAGCQLVLYGMADKAISVVSGTAICMQQVSGQAAGPSLSPWRGAPFLETAAQVVYRTAVEET